MKEKSKRHKAGWRETDRVCRFCGITIPVDRVINKHHLSYSKNIVVPLCYMCHNIIHGRVKYNCPYDKKYGADHGGYFRSKAIITFYSQYTDVMHEILTKDVPNEM